MNFEKLFPVAIIGAIAYFLFGRSETAAGQTRPVQPRTFPFTGSLAPPTGSRTASGQPRSGGGLTLPTATSSGQAQGGGPRQIYEQPTTPASAAIGTEKAPNAGDPVPGMDGYVYDAHGEPIPAAWAGLQPGSWIFNLNGSITTLDANGQWRTVSPGESSTNPDGTITTLNQDGSITTYSPATDTWYDDQGNVIQQGSLAYNPDGTVTDTSTGTTYNAQTNTLTDSSGNVIAQDPITAYNQTGTVYNADGSITDTGTGLTYQPADGSVTDAAENSIDPYTGNDYSQGNYDWAADASWGGGDPSASTADYY